MKIVLPPGVLYDQALLDTTAQLLLGEIIDEQVIPKDVGTLEASHHVAPHPEERRADINAATPYARRLYMHPEYDFRQGENRNAKGQWFEDWVPGGKEGGRAAQIYAALWAKKYGGK